HIDLRVRQCGQHRECVRYLGHTDPAVAPSRAGACRPLARADLGTEPRLAHPPLVDRSGLSTGHFHWGDIAPRADFHTRMNRFAYQPRRLRRHRRRRPDDGARQARSLALASLLTVTLILMITPPASGAHAVAEETSPTVHASSTTSHTTSAA